MLRASSLGLSLPSPTIFAFHQCRRLCGARNGWALVQNGRNTMTTKPTMYPPVFPAPKHEHEDTDEKQRDSAPLSSLADGERDFGPSVSFVYLETVEEMETSALPAGKSLPDTDTPDRTPEIEPEAFLALIHEELESADVLAEIPPVVAWTPVIGVKPRPTDTIKPVEISESLYAPLARLIVDLKIAHQEEDTRRTIANDIEDDQQRPPELLPPRDTGAQIWKNLQILGRTMSVDDAWTAYVYLIDTLSEYPHVQEHIPQIPFSHLHRFCRVLSRHRPKTHRQFLRLLSVMMYIKHCDGDMKQWALNALVDLAGKGWRKTQPSVIAKQMDVFNDLLAGRMPGASEYAPESQNMMLNLAFKADVYTLTSLVTVAARGSDAGTLRELAAMMGKSGLVPNRVAHVAMLRYYEQKRDLPGLRATLQRMRQLNVDLGVEGLNACISAYSRLQKLDVVLMIYRLLRHNVIPEKYRGENDIIETGAQLAEEFIFVEEDVVADKITYVSVIQSMTYHGHFRASMEIFMDMLAMTQRKADNAVASESLDADPPLDQNSPPPPIMGTSSSSQKNEFEPTIAVYRAIFLGFARHAIKPSQVRNSKRDWTLDNLRKFFSRFLLLPSDTHITQAQLWMILDAFGKTSDWDDDELRQVWVAIDMRFGIRLHKPHGHSALVRLRRRLFPDSD